MQMRILKMYDKERDMKDAMRKFINDQGHIITSINKQNNTIQIKAGAILHFAYSETNVRGMTYDLAIIDELVPGHIAMEALTRVR